MTTGKVLRHHRKVAGYSLRALGAEVTVPHTTLAAIERDEVALAPALAARIARVLRIDVAELTAREPTLQDLAADLLKALRGGAAGSSFRSKAEVLAKAVLRAGHG